ncbi:MAG TPA: DNA ligase D [Conexibacter sp.]|jgi:bifunctional non-homologous end joining protein LigD|nr:DNA ligase D [Conexibacter sp.]
MGDPDRLRDYRAKRDFETTSEPAGAAADPTDVAAPRFVVQQHAASRLHWDLRLERDGTLASWALPRGVPLDPHDDRAAIRTEDHPLGYLTFHGEIPVGSYGAGTMEVFDAGTYETHEWTDRKVEVTLHGERLAGRYGLFPIGRRRAAGEASAEAGEPWMIHRLDPPSDPQRTPLPAHMPPMLARADEDGLPQDDDRWGYEVKWDGIRALLWSDHGHVRIESRTQREITARYPELRALGRTLGAHELLLDGELVAFDERGRPSFERLQSRMNVEGEASIGRAARAQPVHFMAFDLLYLDGRSLLELPYERRRGLLEQLGLEGPAWRTPRFHRGGGQALLDATREQGLEGIVAKRLDARYEPGRRSGAWRKLRNRRRQELVIGGWTEGEGRRAGRVGALLLGVHEQPGGPLRYTGRVGSGFSEAMLDELERRLEPLRRTRSPFRADPARPGARPPRGARYVSPQLVAEVELTDLTSEGLVRQGVFKGLRDDKPAADVVPETGLAGEAPPGDAFAAALGGRELRITNRDKLLFPQAGFTKGDLIAYYAQIAPTLLPHLRDRPLTVRRWPDGVEGRTFYEKNAPKHRPDWIETASIYSTGERRRIDYTLVQESATLAWLGNQAAIELHAPLHRATDPEHPTAVVFDLDPGEPAGLAECAEVALVLHGLFERLGLVSVVKTSGGKGLQVYVPLGEGGPTYKHTKPFAHRLATLLEQRMPELVVSRMTKRLRAGKVLVDWSQNDPHKTTVVVYSVRARERPTVSTPLTWDELRTVHDAGAAEALTFDPAAVLTRVAEQGDPFAPLLSVRQTLPAL